MANRRIRMRKIREMIRYHEKCGLSKKKISQALNVSRPVVIQYLNDFKSSGLNYEEIINMSDEDLLQIFEKRKKEKSKRYAELADKFQYFKKELTRIGVTLYLLWEEYKKENHEGYGYSRFCYHYQVWRNASKITMHMEHKAGDKMFADFTGKKLFFIDRKTGRKIEVEVFVAILGASQLTYVEAVPTQNKEDWIKVNENALLYFGGVPCVIVPDNLKSGVSKANKYEPDINPEYSDFARHYDTVIIPARPGKPKDKALVENAVKIAYSRIYAVIRNRQFYSIEELNEAIRDALEKHNNMPFQRLKTSRRELFEEVEKSELKPLPAKRYEKKKFLTSLKVQFNYHVELREDRKYYSVPYRYRGKPVTVIYTYSTVEIYHNNIRIAFHERDRSSKRYITKPEHMPPEHRFYSEWSPQRFINWAGAIGDHVKLLIERVLEKQKHPEQGFKVCLGILNLEKKYGAYRLDNACKRAIDYNTCSYKRVMNILEKGLDKIREESLFEVSLPLHENIRGHNYFY